MALVRSLSAPDVNKALPPTKSTFTHTHFHTFTAKSAATNSPSTAATKAFGSVASNSFSSFSLETPLQPLYKRLAGTLGFKFFEPVDADSIANNQAAMELDEITTGADKPLPTVPDIHVQRASGSIFDPVLEDEVTAKWECCNCHEENEIYLQVGDHPIGALACNCPHKPCSTCTTTGQVKAFLPIEEPAMVPCGVIGDSGKPIEEPEKGIPFGIVCPACGLSWRAREFGKRFSKTLRKTPSLSLNQAVRRAPVEGKLRRTRSSLVLGNNRIVTPPGMEMPKQAEYVAVRFSGITCTCEHNINLKAAFCFQVVIADQEDETERIVKEMMKAGLEGSYAAGWTTDPELQEKGHGTPMLKLGGSVEHPNPLRSSPVMDQFARESWEQKCLRLGWE
ncbi:hypothetical protein BU23DRAFT_638739 [Bimuria novae-zelandiae CBS 107.79]|uniref:Probable double zinc ribbon domain-containing protein n=1 Tax=Bimuria novae-zelandiae CBS 107.79 TaxID=1447943 RepID=A0A6A5VG78_9PLEO|nr:hypothetical protein BU23DRAFT_638739 [Bimuria novae-zelandiae CBS 107.79]